MTTIARHATDLERAARSARLCAEELPEDLALARETPHGLWSVYEAEKSHAAWRSVADPTANEIQTWEAVVRAMQAGAALLTIGTAPPGTSVTATLDEQATTWTATAGMTHLHPGTWLDVVSLVTVCRDQERTDLLCAIDPRALSTPGVTVLPHVGHWAYAWQRVWRKAPDAAVDALVDALHASMPDRIPATTRRYVDLIDAPQMALLGHYLSQDQAEFGKTLITALESHKEWWSSPERADDPDGLIAWRVLALACLAKEVGWAVPVESDYLPAQLLDGGWVGEIDT